MQRKQMSKAAFPFVEFLGRDQSNEYFRCNCFFCAVKQVDEQAQQECYGCKEIISFHGLR